MLDNMDPRKKRFLYIGLGVAAFVLVFGLILGLTLRKKDDGENTTTAPPVTLPPELQEPKTQEQILADLREEMKNSPEKITAYLLATPEESSSAVLDRDRRVKYISGFTGSNAVVVVTQEKAALWTDSRYTEQASNELDTKLWEVMDQTHLDWLKAELEEGAIVGVNEFLISSSEYTRLSTSLAVSGITLTGMSNNIVDSVWNNQPELKTNPIVKHELEYSGIKSGEKVKILRDTLKSHPQVVGMIVTGASEIAYLLNLRGSDQNNLPVFLSFLIITENEIALYAIEEHVTDAIKQYLVSEGIENLVVKPYGEALLLEDIAEYLNTIEGKFLVPHVANAAIYNAIPADRRYSDYSPIELMKVVKNEVEAKGMVTASKRDSVAIIRFLTWLENNIDGLNTELSVAAKLLEFRNAQRLAKGPSFTSISAFGAHAAMPHYSPTTETDVVLTKDNVYLIDSGGHYLDGTTDVTRTIFLGTTPGDAIKNAFTRVLKGFLAIDAAIFPKNAYGTYFDALGRQSLWEDGLDYGHGTGHGIGHYSDIHEYPPLLGASGHYATSGLVENMFTSNEPGYYEEGQFGIRLENVLQVIPAGTSARHTFGDRGAFKFHTCTLVPIDKKMIDLDLLTDKEIKQLNDYHALILTELRELLTEQDGNALNWLEQQITPIARPPVPTEAPTEEPTEEPTEPSVPEQILADLTGGLGAANVKENYRTTPRGN